MLHPHFLPFIWVYMGISAGLLYYLGDTEDATIKAGYKVETRDFVSLAVYEKQEVVG